MRKILSQVITSLFVMAFIVSGSIWSANYFYFDSANQELEAKRARLEELKRSNDELEQIKEKADELERALKEAEGRFNALMPLVPHDPELPRIFDWLAAKAIERNLKLENFSRQGGGQVIQEKNGFIQIPLQVEIFGSYDSATRFLEDFSRFKRVLRVDGINMIQEQQQQSLSGTLHGTIYFSAFTSK